MRKSVWVFLSCLVSLGYIGCNAATENSQVPSGHMGPVAAGATPADQALTQSFPDEGHIVVPESDTPTYRTDPPTSGPQYSTIIAPGVYDNDGGGAVTQGKLVHAMYHSNVILYFDPSRLTDSDHAKIVDLAGRYTDPFAGIVAISRPDPQHAIIATAWTKRIELETLDLTQLQPFIDQFIGHGPMNALGPEIQAFLNEGATHVPVGTVIQYDTDPPTSGNHYPDPAANGFYTVAPALGFLVHSLEHSNVEIWYDASHLSAADMSALQTLVGANWNPYGGLLAVPRQDAQYPIILTSWQHMLRLPGYDVPRIQEFMGFYMGNGPETSML